MLGVRQSFFTMMQILGSFYSKNDVSSYYPTKVFQVFNVVAETLKEQNCFVDQYTHTL